MVLSGTGHTSFSLPSAHMGAHPCAYPELQPSVVKTGVRIRVKTTSPVELLAGLKVIMYRKGHVSPNAFFLVHSEILSNSQGQTHSFKASPWLTLASVDQLDKTQPPLGSGQQVVWEATVLLKVT